MGETENSEKQPRRGAFKPGVSGNPGGRPGELGEFRRLCRTHKERAIEGLLKALDGGGTAAVSAARVLLEYGFGKPQSAPEDNEALSKAGLPLTREELLRVAKLTEDDES